MSGATTNVIAPTFGPSGLATPPETAILAARTADINAAFGGGLNPGLSTPQGQLASSETAIIGDANDTFLMLASMCDPAYASGRFQDALARIYFIDRNPAQSTVVQGACHGLGGVAIPLGALAQDTASGTVYYCTAGGTIPATGTITLPFAAAVTGPLPVPVAMTVYLAIPGWDAVTPLSGVLGNVVESRADFEFRRQQSIAKNAVGTLPAIQANVLGVPGVLDAYTTENYTSAAVTTGGVTLAQNSLYVAVAGGAPLDVATAIWLKKMPGCGYTGNTTVTVLDARSGYSAPYPAYPVTFETAIATPIYFAVTMSSGAAVPSDALVQVQGVIMRAFAGADGGTRARIGSKIYASRYYGGIGNLGPWAQIIEVLIGTASPPTGFFVQMQINQVPTIAAGNITLALQ